jgi:hypothetical protein
MVRGRILWIWSPIGLGIGGCLSDSKSSIAEWLFFQDQPNGIVETGISRIIRSEFTVAVER